MVNPIYSGPIYDSVYDARGRLLNSNASTPSSVGAPEFPPPNGYIENRLYYLECILEKKTHFNI